MKRINNLTGIRFRIVKQFDRYYVQYTHNSKDWYSDIFDSDLSMHITPTFASYKEAEEAFLNCIKTELLYNYIDMS